MPLGLLENSYLRLKSLSHRKVGSEFTKGSSEPHDPIYVLADGEVSVHAGQIERVGDGVMNLRWPFMARRRHLSGDLSVGSLFRPAGGALKPLRR